MIFAKVPVPYVKFDEKHDEDFTEPVRPTVLKLRTNFLQKGTRAS